jgi:hypothetical protein
MSKHGNILDRTKRCGQYCHAIRYGAARLTLVAAALTIGTAVIQTASPASAAADGTAPSWGFETLLDASFPVPATLSPFMVPAAATPGSMTPEMAVFTRKGISPARASQALSVEGRLVQTQLVNKVETALAGAYAGAWFESADAKLHIGVTSNASRQAAASVVAGAGLGAAVIETPVRSTRAALLAAQKRWDTKLARLVVPGQTITGIDSQRNAVVVKLSSSVSPSKRAMLEHAAASANVSIVITIVPPSQLRVQPKNTTCEFTSTFAESPRYAWCEKTITSGVKIYGPEIDEERQVCTAGPMLIKGLKTFVLTAGHCVESGEKKVGEVWESEYPNPKPPRKMAATIKLGKVSAFTYTKALDSAEIEVEQPGVFAAALPTPVPALMAEWGNWRGWHGKPHEGEPAKPIAVAPELQFESKAVSGESLPVKGYADCHEGARSGEQCGEVLMENVVKPNPKANPIETENLVEDSACSETGDSGGPYFYYAPPGWEIYMEGTEVGGVIGECAETGKGGAGTPNYFEPMKTLLKQYKGQRLLTTANEIRKPRVKRTGGASLVKKVYTSSSGASTIETVAGSKLTCTADSGKGEASAESSGTAKLTLTGCETSGEKCHTTGAAEGEVVLSANYKLAFTNGAKDEVGLLLELTEATIECGKNCEGKTVETLKLRGTGIGATTPIDEEVVPPKKFTIAFSQTKGVQTPTEYEREEGNKAKAILELEGGGAKVFKFEQAGLSDTDELLFEETAEIEP